MRHCCKQNTTLCSMIIVGIVLAATLNEASSTEDALSPQIRGKWHLGRNKKIKKHKDNKETSQSQSPQVAEETEVSESSEPSTAPSMAPSRTRSQLPTAVPSNAPSTSPSEEPTITESNVPSTAPSAAPSVTVTVQADPTSSSTKSPTDEPTSPPTFRPSAAPTIFPTDQCQISTFTNEIDGWMVGDGAITVGFTTEIILDVDCLADYANETIIEATLLSYQNDLLIQSGCYDKIQFVAGDITSICPLNDNSECVNIEEICDSDTSTRRNRRGLQTSSINSATVRYKYNSMANCRRRCAEQAMPKESDDIGSGGGGGGNDVGGGEDDDARLMRTRMLRSLGQDDIGQSGDDRSQLVGLLTEVGIKTYGAFVLSDERNDCSPGTEECCGTEGKCCGVTTGCTCPSVSETYCAVTNCDLPGCCGDSPSWLSATGNAVGSAAPEFSGCDYTKPACECSMLFLCEAEFIGCNAFTVCGASQNVCP